MISIRGSRADEQGRLYEIWHDAVRATHGFLAEEDFRFYTGLVRDEMLPTGVFWVAADDVDRPLGFLQIEGTKVEALFVDSRHHGRGIGTALMVHARKISPLLEVDANEESGAASFYRGLGFEEVSRSPTDGRGHPYPLIHMRLRG